MAIVCSKCKKVHETEECPIHGKGAHTYEYQNSDDFLKKEVKRVIQERRELGLEGLVGGLDAIIINVETHLQQKTIQEFLDSTGYEFQEAFEDDFYISAVLSLSNSANILIRSRKQAENPYEQFNIAPKSKHLPNTRLETFMFRCTDISKYVAIQKKRGVEFLTEDIIESADFLMIVTKPSRYTGISVGLIQRLNDGQSYKTKHAVNTQFTVKKVATDYLHHIGRLDHTASRVRAKERDAAIIEFMELTNYHFDFAIYVEMFNSITNVARLSMNDFAMVFTSGISPYKNDNESGPTEKFIHNYNPRTHHMAFETEHIEFTFDKLKQNGMKFLVDLVGSPAEGLKQTFSESSPNTLLVNEYIHRYGDFDGFFTRSNVTQLTASTDKQ